MMIKIGFIHSLSETMSISEKPLAEAGILAVDEINAQGGVLGHPVEYMLTDGASNPERFAAQAKYLITECGTTALFGGWNSHTRKAVKPIVEQYDSSFWYPMSYEGLEGSPNIFYTGSTINQQVMPAID
jgi:urea transport system substrate-binding protein